MKFTWHWLLDHLQTDKNINEIVDTLPKLGLEVASVINLADELKDFISVKVLEVKSHPNADKLNICKVFNGNNSFNVVCVFRYFGTTTNYHQYFSSKTS